MDKYTIKPLVRLFAQQPRPQYTRKDIIQLAQAVRAGPNAPKWPILEIYNAVFTDLIATWPPRQKLAAAEISARADSCIRKNELNFHLRPSACAHENYFNPVAEKTGQRYDLAFYHVAAPRIDKPHHTFDATAKPGQQDKHPLPDLQAPPPAGARAQKRKRWHDVFYVRCEEFNNSLLVGNMQVDDRGFRRKWKPRHYRGSIGKEGNIYKIMIQETIKWALAHNYEKIIFMAGYANEIAQSGESSDDQASREMITEETIAREQARYAAWQAQIAALRPGDIIYRPCRLGSSEIDRCTVISATPRRIEYCEAGRDSLIVAAYNLTYREGFRKGITKNSVRGDFVKKINLADRLALTGGLSKYKDFIDTADDLAGMLNFNDINQKAYRSFHWAYLNSTKRYIHAAHLTHYPDLVWGYLLRDAPRMLAAINKIFDYVVRGNYQEKTAEKIAYLENLFKTAPRYPGEYSKQFDTSGKTPPRHFPLTYEILQPFLMEFDYHKPLLENFSSLKLLPKVWAGSRNL